MKIALVSANLFDIGGVENNVRFIGPKLESLGHELLLFKPTWSDELERARSLDDGIQSSVVDLGPKPYEQHLLPRIGYFPYLQGLMRRASFSVRAGTLRDAVVRWRPDLV